MRVIVFVVGGCLFWCMFSWLCVLIKVPKYVVVVVYVNVNCEACRGVCS